MSDHPTLLHHHRTTSPTTTQTPKHPPPTSAPLRAASLHRRRELSTTCCTHLNLSTIRGIFEPAVTTAELIPSAEFNLAPIQTHSHRQLRPTQISANSELVQPKLPLISLSASSSAPERATAVPTTVPDSPCSCRPRDVRWSMLRNLKPRLPSPRQVRHNHLLPHFYLRTSCQLAPVRRLRRHHPVSEINELSMSTAELGIVTIRPYPNKRLHTTAVFHHFRENCQIGHPCNSRPLAPVCRQR